MQTYSMSPNSNEIKKGNNDFFYLLVFSNSPFEVARSSFKSKNEQTVFKVDNVLHSPKEDECTNIYN